MMYKLILCVICMIWTPTDRSMDPPVRMLCNPEKPYHLSLDLDRIHDHEYNLSIDIDLDSSSYFISAFSEGHYMGRFTLSIPENEYLKIDGKMQETPLTKDEINPWNEGQMVRFVKENTVYDQKIKRISDMDFEVRGDISFVIEPACTMEQIGFLISYSAEDDNLSVLRSDP